MMKQPGDDILRRKGDHIRLCLDDDSQSSASVFDSIVLPYRALPDINLSDVSTQTLLLGKTLSQPLIISSMTGGTEHGARINTNLAAAAQAQRVALGVGSERVGLENESTLSTFETIRKHAPTAFIFANLGAVQLNYGYTVDHYRRAVDLVRADALYLHLNPLQEAIQPGGNSNYANLSEKVIKLIRDLDIPVFIKEVGHGIDAETARLLIDAGVAGIDVAGVGGTSYAWVEARRAGNARFEKWFKEFGITTEQAVRAVAALKSDALLIASGGIRNPVQGYKAHTIGADYYAAARPFLKAALESDEAVVEAIRDWQAGLAIAMFTTGLSTW